MRAAAKLTNQLLDGVTLNAVHAALKGCLQRADPILPFTHFEWCLTSCSDSLRVSCD